MAKNIIIIDDDQYIRELYEEILKEAGYEVDTAKDGLEGFEKLHEGGYDMVVMDVIMPKLDGIGILTKLEEEPPKKKNGPIVLLTNLANDPAVEEAMQKGAESFFIKANITPEDFLNKVKSLVG